jgi:type VI secretion system protein ImpE
MSMRVWSGGGTPVIVDLFVSRSSVMSQLKQNVLPVLHMTGEGFVEAMAGLMIFRTRRHEHQQLRMFLLQSLCVEGELENDGAQSPTLSELTSGAKIVTVDFHQRITGEAAKAAYFAGSGKAPLPIDPNGGTTDLIVTIDPEVASHVAVGVQLRSAALDRAPQTSGTVVGRPFEALIDSDRRFGATLEATVARRWRLTPLSSVGKIIAASPINLRDLVWLQPKIRFHEGRASAALAPVCYRSVECQADADIRLARRTERRETAYASHSASQSMWTTDKGKDVGRLPFRSVKLARP